MGALQFDCSGLKPLQVVPQNEKSRKSENNVSILFRFDKILTKNVNVSLKVCPNNGLFVETYTWLGIFFTLFSHLAMMTKHF